MRCIGLDLGGTNIKAVLLEGTAGAPATVLQTTSAPTDAQEGPAAVAERLVGVARSLGGAGAGVGVVGIGAPGLFDAATGEVRLFPNLPGPWRGFGLSAAVARGLGRPVSLVNDARAFTLAEARLGAGRGCRTMVGVTLGTGVGGGVVLDGRLHLGAWGIAGEIGHQTVLPDGPLCGCGNRGCAEALTQAAALCRLAGQATAEDVYAAARAGDARARSAVATVSGYLGIAIGNVVAVLGPERVVVGGGIATAGELVFAPLRAAVRARAHLMPAEEVAVVPAALGTAAGAIGAALAALDGLEPSAPEG